MKTILAWLLPRKKGSPPTLLAYYLATFNRK